MKKLWLTLALGLVVLVVGGLVVLRAAAKSFVESEEFRSGFGQALEKAAGSVVPRAMARVQKVKLVGLASLEIDGIKIQSTKSLGAAVSVTRVRVTPELLSLLGKGPVRVAATGTMDGKGRFDFTASVPKSLLLEENAQGADSLGVQGNLDKVDIVPISSLLFSDAPSNPNFRLTRGTLTGTFLFKKPFSGPASQGRKSGDINAKLENATWALAVGPVKKLEPPPLDLHIEIKDFVLELRAPVVLADKIGRATIGGALLLPERADRTMEWDLEVKTEGLILQGSLAKLFQCKQPPLQPNFRVKGPIARTTCK